jgi:hypothetical protein
MRRPSAICSAAGSCAAANPLHKSTIRPALTIRIAFSFAPCSCTSARHRHHAGKSQGNVVVFTTTDPPAQVIAFYVQAAGGAGYRVAQQMNMGPTAMMTATRGEREDEGLTVTATGAGGATQVQVVVGHGRR